MQQHLVEESTGKVNLPFSSHASLQWTAVLSGNTLCWPIKRVLLIKYEQVYTV